MPKFLLQYEGAVLKEIPAKVEITIGRKPDNDVVIDNAAVSSHHCKITLIGETYFVEDLNSTNGVFLNATKTERAELKNNDVIGIAKHALKFIDDRPLTAEAAAPAAPAPARSADATMMFSPKKQQDLAATSVTAAQKKPAVIRVIKGIVDKMEYELNARSTYIGKSDRVQIKIKGAGFFRSAPENAAMIGNTAEGYFIIPVKERYAKLNGKVVVKKELLMDGDVIEVGGTTLQFEDKPAG